MRQRYLQSVLLAEDTLKLEKMYAPQRKKQEIEDLIPSRQASFNSQFLDRFPKKLFPQLDPQARKKRKEIADRALKYGAGYSVFSQDFQDNEQERELEQEREEDRQIQLPPKVPAVEPRLSESWKTLTLTGAFDPDDNTFASVSNLFRVTSFQVDMDATVWDRLPIYATSDFIETIVIKEEYSHKDLFLRPIKDLLVVRPKPVNDSECLTTIICSPTEANYFLSQFHQKKVNSNCVLTHIFPRHAKDNPDVTFQMATARLDSTDLTFTKSLLALHLLTGSVTFDENEEALKVLISFLGVIPDPSQIKAISSAGWDELFENGVITRDGFYIDKKKQRDLSNPKDLAVAKRAQGSTFSFSQASFLLKINEARSMSSFTPYSTLTKFQIFQKETEDV